ncbi:uncharacterized protein LOC105700013 isoform X2 [Orussus abietinus]|uniref:uncharacterized protein LOC105700013 isoform X2 n=1 Tax=Orussus abietinus TaxID=222816 RepID=UPI0006251992|nr:uncharacterized protein LOC105700013 isoform X2 [Orussus abietinus]
MGDLNVDVTIPFPTAREAEIAFEALKVDPEPKRSGVTKNLSLHGNLLKVSFSGTEARKVRVGLTGFFDSLILVTETMNEFGPPEPEYTHY